MEKILFITYYWPPSGGAGVQRSLKFVKYLPEFGIEPIVLTVDPSKATYPLLDESLTAELPADLRVLKTNSFEALQVLASLKGKENLPYGGFARSGKEKFYQKILRFIRGNFFIPDARKGWVNYAFKTAVEVIRQEEIKTVVISSPPHSSQLIGIKLKSIFPQLRWIADLRDPWTDIYYYKDLLHTVWASRKDAKLEKTVLENCDAVLCVSESIRQLFLQKSDKLTPEKIVVLPNGFDESDFFEKNIPKSNQFTFTYVGTMADSYNPDALLEALARFIERHPELRVKVKFVGSVSAKVHDWIQRNSFDQLVEVTGHVSHAEAIRCMQQANVLLLVIPDVQNAEGILTGKLFEYLAAQRPILALGPADGDAAGILDACASGKMFERDAFLEMDQWLELLYSGYVSGKQWVTNQDKIRNYSRKTLSRLLSEVILSKNK